MDLKSRPNKRARCIAVLGTGSDVGKSVIATALCRFLADQGIRVAPYKAQNMSNNSGVTPEGLEMGRAQIVQAEAARIVPHVNMNPILLKPTSEVGSQIVMLGRVLENASARQYHQRKIILEKTAREALDQLRNEVDVVVMEGAGSCAEVNLMANDIVNLRMAEYAEAPVILVADIHRGGVFAQIVGTLACLSSKQRRLISGFIVNRFRGDISLFDDGVKWIEQKTGKPVFGVMPWYFDFKIEDEDSVVIENPDRVVRNNIRKPAVAVIRIPHISNFTDFDPILKIEALNLYFLESVQNLNDFSAVILPGSKSTRSDLEWLHETGWTDMIRAYSEKGGHIMGICGGYQMMGQAVHDPAGIEGKPGMSQGLSLLPVETELRAPKTTTRTVFSWNGRMGSGYEIHMGRTTRYGGAPLFQVHKKNEIIVAEEDGCISDDARHTGTYIHGLFDEPVIIKTWLKQIGIPGLNITEVHGPAARDADYAKLSEYFESHVDMDGILQLIQQ